MERGLFSSPPPTYHFHIVHSLLKAVPNVDAHLSELIWARKQSVALQMFQPTTGNSSHSLSTWSVVRYYETVTVIIQNNPHPSCRLCVVMEELDLSAWHKSQSQIKTRAGRIANQILFSRAPYHSQSYFSKLGCHKNKSEWRQMLQVFTTRILRIILQLPNFLHETTFPKLP